MFIAKSMNYLMKHKHNLTAEQKMKFLTLTPICTGGKSPCSAGGNRGSGMGKGQDIMVAT